MQTTNIKTTIFSVIFALGVLPGFLLILLATWADLESTFYGFNRLASAQLNGLYCPILMARGETTSFSLKVTNTLERAASPVVRVDISTPILPYSKTERFSLDVDDSVQVRWEIGPENIDLGNFVFAQVVLYSMYPIPNRQGSCGVFVVDLPGNGQAITWTAIALSVLGMGVGLYGLNQQQRLRGNEDIMVLRPFTLLSIVVVAGIVASLMGWWIPAIMLLVVTILLIFSTLGVSINRMIDKSSTD